MYCIDKTYHRARHRPTIGATLPGRSTFLCQARYAFSQWWHFSQMLKGPWVQRDLVSKAGSVVPENLVVEIPAGKPAGTLGTVLERSRLLALKRYNVPRFATGDHLEMLSSFRDNQNLSSKQEAVFAGNPRSGGGKAWQRQQGTVLQWQCATLQTAHCSCLLCMCMACARSGGSGALHTTVLFGLPHVPGWLSSAMKRLKWCAAAVALYAWRDRTARERDESLDYILSRRQLLNIARGLPSNPKELKRSLCG